MPKKKSKEQKVPLTREDIGVIINGLTYLPADLQISENHYVLDLRDKLRSYLKRS